MKTESNFFTFKELRCKESGIVSLAPNFATKLDILRATFGQPMIVNSCCRSLAYNKKIGGHVNSAHVFNHPARSFEGSYAIDIHALGGKYKADLVSNALLLGWSVGVADTYIHLDRRTDYYPDKQQTVYNY